MLKLLELYFIIGLVTGGLGIFLLWYNWDEFMDLVEEEIREYDNANKASFATLTVFIMLFEAIVLWPMNIREIMEDMWDVFRGNT